MMGMHKHLCTPENVVIAMYEYYQSDHSLRETAEQFGISINAVYKSFKRQQFHVRSRSHALYLAHDIEPEVRAMYRDYQAGMSHKQIGTKYQYAASTVTYRFRQYKLPSRTAWDWRRS